jgi:hypothetical protein
MSNLGYISPFWPPNLSATGTAVTPAIGTIYFVKVDVLIGPWPITETAGASFAGWSSTLTGVAFNIGSATPSTEKAIVALYSSSGTLLANSALAGTAVTGTANSWSNEIPFTSPYATRGPDHFFIAVQFDTATAGLIRCYIVPTTGIGFKTLTGSQTGTFGTLPTITVPTTMANNVGPVSYLY